jgi:hypothetical protein
VSNFKEAKQANRIKSVMHRLGETNYVHNSQPKLKQRGDFLSQEYEQVPKKNEAKK